MRVRCRDYNADRTVQQNCGTFDSCRTNQRRNATVMMKRRADGNEGEEEREHGGDSPYERLIDSLSVWSADLHCCKEFTIG